MFVLIRFFSLSIPCERFWLYTLSSRLRWIFLKIKFDRWKFMYWLRIRVRHLQKGNRVERSPISRPRCPWKHQWGRLIGSRPRSLENLWLYTTGTPRLGCVLCILAKAMSRDFVTNSYGQSRDSSCKISSVPVKNQWVPVKKKTSPKLKMLGPSCNQTVIWRKTPKLCITVYSIIVLLF